MKTTDFNLNVSSEVLNENMFKKFGTRIDFKKYSREQLENYRNLLRTKLSDAESNAGYNDLLQNESYQKDKFVLDLLNTKIKEMLGEAKLAKRDYDGDGEIETPKDEVWGSRAKAAAKAGKPFKEDQVNEKAVSKAQQQAAGVALAAKRSGSKPPGKGASAQMSKMSTKELEKFAGTKHKGLPKHKKSKNANEGRLSDAPSANTPAALAAERKRKQQQIQQKIAADELAANKQERELRRQAGTKPPAKGSPMKTTESKAKPDFLDLNKNKNRQEPMKTAAKEKAANEKVAKKGNPFAKPKTKPAKKDKKENPFASTKKAKGKKDSKSPFGKVKKKANESVNRQNYRVILEGLKRFIAEDEEGKAKDITAGSDMVNDFTGWMQRIGQYQTKTMIELADSIRANFGQAEAEQFKTAIQPALQSSLEALTQSRETITKAVAVLAGEESPESPMGGEPPTEMPAGPDSMNEPPPPPSEDEFAASDAAAGGAETAGREKRESREFFRAQKLAEAHSIMRKLAK